MLESACSILGLFHCLLTYKDLVGILGQEMIISCGFCTVSKGRNKFHQAKYEHSFQAQYVYET